MSRLPADCLNEIFEYLENDEVTLRSCLLVNRLWYEISVRILWRSVRNYSTLIACLSKESKETLYESGITIPTPTSKPTVFNYAAYCKVLSTYHVHYGIQRFLIKQQCQNLIKNINIVAHEIYKLLMNQISSLRKLHYTIHKPAFTSYPKAKNCFKNLSELHCRSDIDSRCVYWLSQICHNIQSLCISLERIISCGLTYLISVQQNLKCLQFSSNYRTMRWINIIPSSTKLPNTLKKLEICGVRCTTLSFITNFKNLQELIFDFQIYEDSFKELQYVTFPKLQILRFQYGCPRQELLIKFLENNAKNLKELYVETDNNSLQLAIAKFSPNLKIIN